MADGGQLFNTLGGGISGASADRVSQVVGIDSQSYVEGMFVLGDMFSVGVLKDDATLADSFIGKYELSSTFSRGFPVAVTSESPTLSTGGVSLSLDGSTTPGYVVFPLENIVDGIAFSYGGLAFDGGSSPAAPTLYKMRAYQTGAQVFEYWASSGAPALVNPSGLPIAAESVTVVAVKRQVQLV